MRFAKCAFGAGERTYTYELEIDDVDIGDRVIVATNKGEAPATVREITEEAPPFPCKPVLRKAPPKDPAPAPVGPTFESTKMTPEERRAEQRRRIDGARYRRKAGGV